MAKIYIVKISEKWVIDGRNDDYDEILKAFASLKSANTYMIECFKDRVEERKGLGADIIYQDINENSAYMNWCISDWHGNGIVKFIILERELAE